MKQRIISFLAFIMLVMGLSLLLYPTVSNYFNTQKQRKAIFNYIYSAETMPDEDYSEILKQAKKFNKQLASGGYMLMNLPEGLREQYYSLLDVNGDGVIGYIDVPDVNIMLSIYHGASDAVLQEGTGHIEGSSFPIEGKSAHAVISGHRGQPSALLFTNLDKLEVGQTFVIYVLDNAYMYRIRAIETVEPTEVSSLGIEKGKNYCTLVTCTPYGINSHRLLLHGELLDRTETERELVAQSGAQYIPAYQIIIIFEIPAVILAVLISTRRTRKKR